MIQLVNLSISFYQYEISNFTHFALVLRDPQVKLGQPLLRRYSHQLSCSVGEEQHFLAPGQIRPQ